MFKTTFHSVLTFFAPQLAQAEAAVEQDFTSGASKKQKVLDIAIAGMTTLNVLPSLVTGHPEFQAAAAKANDALIEVANVAQRIHDEANPANGATGGSSPSTPR